MQTFLEWLESLCEERQKSVPPEILKSYEYAFQEKLKELLQRTQDPRLRARFEEMLKCPLRDRRGNCRGFAEYILGALVKNDLGNRYDLEAALAYVVEKMLMDR